MDDRVGANSLAWRYSAYKTENEETELTVSNFQFVHMFATPQTDGGVAYSHDAYIIEPIVEKINPTNIERIKANLQTKVCKQEVDIKGFHTDQEPDDSRTKYNAIYYVNDNNGYTVFKKDGTKVESKANRLLVFRNELYHTGLAPSDTNVRVVINLTFSKKGGCLGVK